VRKKSEQISSNDDKRAANTLMNMHERQGTKGDHGKLMEKVSSRPALRDQLVTTR
jgi:hypothetical protein